MNKLFLLSALFVAAAFSSCSKHDIAETPVLPEPVVEPDPQPLAIVFAEGYSLEFNVNETKIVHYTITGGNDNTVVKVEMQTSDDAYTVETTPTSTTEGTIAITAQMPEAENYVVVIVSDGSQIVTAKIAVSTNPIPEVLTITFSEGNSLQFDVDEVKTIRYTITGSSANYNNVVKAEMQNPDNAYTLFITSISATEGTITITAKTPEAENCVLVTVSDGSQTVTAEIAVSTNPIPEKLAIAFAEGNSLKFDVDETKIVHYTITGGSDKTVVKAKMQKSDDAYTVETTPTSATEGTIAITAQTPEAENCVLITVSDGSQIVTAKIAVSTNPISEELAITFSEGNSLELYVDEPKTIHYTITGGSDKTVIKAEMQYPGNTYTVETTPTSATEGTIAITATKTTNNRVVLTVSDRGRSITAWIDIVVTLKAFDGKTIVVETPGTLAELLAGYDKTTITELTVIGNLNSSDIWTLKNLPNLAVLDMEYANLEELPYKAFDCKTLLTSVKLPLTLKTIGEDAFQECRSLTSITIGNSVTTIGNYAFFNCWNLTSVTIGNSVTTIGYKAFCGCRSLTSITIPDSVTTIWGSAFEACSGLTSVTIGNSVTTIRDSTFYGCSSLTSITIGNSVTAIGYDAFNWCSSLTDVYITDIAKWCAIEFSGIASNPLCYAHNLYLNGELVTELVIPDGVTSIGDDAFGRCSSLTSVTIPDSVTSIGGAFGGCSNLTSVTIGNGVTSIVDYAFSGCSSLTSVTIGSGVTSIGNWAFYECSNLKSIYCKAIVPPNAFYSSFPYNRPIITLYVPTGRKAAYAAADGWRYFTTIEEVEF